MPIIRRAQINKFKEVLISESAGLIQDSLGGYTLDDPSLNPNGTGDFLGVIKTAVLLGRVEIHTVDTRNLSIAQFNNLTQQEFDNYVRVGLIRYNQPTGTPEVLGWVEMGRTNASFYYETCPGGKRPVSEHYYDMAAFAFDNKLVYGEGLELIPSSATAIGGPNTPLTPIGNFDPNWYTNMGPIAPRFDPLTLPQYMYSSLFNDAKVINSDGEVRGISAGMYSSQSRPLRKNILFANRNEHFDNKFVVEITPGKWGAVRGVIEQSIVANVVGVQNPITGVTVNMDFGLSKGECLQIVSVTPSGGTTTTVTTGGPTPPVVPPVIPPVMPPPIVIQNDNVRDSFVNPTLDQLESFKQNLLKKIKDLGFVYDQNLKTLSTEESYAYIIPDIKKYPEILQLYHCYQINRNRLINESKVDYFVEKVMSQYSKGGITESNDGLNSQDKNMGV